MAGGRNPPASSAKLSSCHLIFGHLFTQVALGLPPPIPGPKASVGAALPQLLPCPSTPEPSKLGPQVPGYTRKPLPLGGLAASVGFCLDVG